MVFVRLLFVGGVVELKVRLDDLSSCSRTICRELVIGCSTSLSESACERGAGGEVR